MSVVKSKQTVSEGIANPIATHAATVAFEAAKAKAKAEGREVTADEMNACEEAAFKAVEAHEDQQAAESDNQAVQREITLQHAYYAAQCNAVRGVGDLEVGIAREAAATLQIAAVDFETWKRRLGY